MRSLPVLLFAVSMLAVGCGEKPKAAETPKPVQPRYSDVWYTSAADRGLPVALNLHQTAQGLAGRVVTGDGVVSPARGMVQTADKLTFMSPGMDATFELAKSGEGAWSGQMIVGDKTTPLAFSPGSAPDLKTRRFIALPDGRQMLLDCRGSGTPAVVFDAGAGSSSATWSVVQDEVAKTTLACAYDRAGHGLSDSRPLPLDAAAVADDIDAMLDAAAIKGPYVVVGHSLGSYHVRQFANTRFDKTAGMVLVDPSGDGQGARFAKVLPRLDEIQGKTRNQQKELNCVARMREKLVPRADPLFEKCGRSNDAELIEQTQSEVDSMAGASTEQLTESHRSYGDMPLIVLTRGDYKKDMPPEFTDADRDAMKKVWVGMHTEMAALSTQGALREVPGAGHNIQRDQPQAVIDAVNEVVAKARARMSKT